ncbi:MAG: nucleoside-diphosphate sugar epimerase/dehydratase [Rhodospirillales bacterium]|jgi:O-antigen biosynthesis protein WbqV|nr:nucleoside-diphosphate sugar epimerase/dehydratase [Rhodospirillales bacterium]MDP6773658.1 nucleoside-diphosphate sugar epimerase/dehydratase [Rhodospirillales bacterium]
MVLDPRRLKPAYIAYAHDIVMAALSFALSLYLRLGAELFDKSIDWLLVGTILFTVVCAVAFWFMRLYRGIWRYASLNDLLAITRAVTLAILVFLVLMFLWTRLEQVPRSLPFINWFVLIALLGGPRFLYRLIKDRRFDLNLENGGQRRIPVLLVGAGDAAELFIRATSRPGGADYRVVGIVAERPANVGRHIHGIEAMGTTEELPAVVEELAARGDRPQRLILTKDGMDGAKVRTLLDGATEAGMTMARLPKLTDFKSGVDDKMEIRPVAVEDLLGRPQTTLDRGTLSAFIKGRRVLITGAGGSIGGELVRQISDFAPAELVLLDNSEFNLYSVEMALAERHPALARHAIIGDVRDSDRIGGLFAAIRPELVFHAAALKHVPLVETNPVEGVTTNVIGTVNVADACMEAGAAAMVMISTDKAVNPTSVMGATKRIAEQYCQALDLVRHGTDGTRFITVRFGNVLGSTGSVVPLFQRQLAQGGPLTVTDPEMKRYFMTVSEAVALVLQASAHGSRDSEHEGKILVLDMGEPVRILDLARQLIRLAGLRPDDDIKIEFIGSRPGEKLSEETFHGGEPLVPTETKGVLLATPRPGDHQELSRSFDDLAEACARSDTATISEILHQLVPEYRGAAESPARAASA